MKTLTNVSFARGFSRTLDLTGAKEWPELSNDRRADYEALRSDWEHVGRTIQGECERYEKSELQ